MDDKQTFCNRSACKTPLNHRNRWWNTSTQAWYCQPCAFRINDFAGDARVCIPEVELLREQNEKLVKANEELQRTLASTINYIEPHEDGFKAFMNSAFVEYVKRLTKDVRQG